MAKYSKADQAEALANLRKWIKPGDTVYTILRHVSRSGMRREIGIMLLPKGKRGAAGPMHPNFAVACALGLPMATTSRDGVKMGGCGMDMGFALVYELGSRLWPKGKTVKCNRCAGTGSRSAVRFESPDADGTPEVLPCRECDGKGKRRVSGGYLIRHEWI